jgi:hypothetical protein
VGIDRLKNPAEAGLTRRATTDPDSNPHRNWQAMRPLRDPNIGMGSVEHRAASTVTNRWRTPRA